MAHRVMDGAATYGITGGKVLDEATVYGIKKGRCMVDGTAFDILFRKTQTVNISGSMDSSYGYVKINGEKITSPGTYTYETEEVLGILVYVSAGTVAGRAGCYVKLNGSVVQSTPGSYEMITEANVINISIKTGFNTQVFYYAEITTS